MKQLRTTEVFGGPLDGTKHAIKDPFDMGIEPAAIALPVDLKTLAWYTKNETGQYHFTRTELRPALALAERKDATR
jgi:hypothetical protein